MLAPGSANHYGRTDLLPAGADRQRTSVYFDLRVPARLETVSPQRNVSGGKKERITVTQQTHPQAEAMISNRLTAFPQLPDFGRMEVCRNRVASRISHPSSASLPHCRIARTTIFLYNLESSPHFYTPHEYEVFLRYS